MNFGRIEKDIYILFALFLLFQLNYVNLYYSQLLLYTQYDQLAYSMNLSGDCIFLSLWFTGFQGFILFLVIPYIVESFKKRYFDE